jgi:hypothetical protein
MTVMVAVWRKMLSRLLAERNPSSRNRTAKKAKTTRKPM